MWGKNGRSFFNASVDGARIKKKVSLNLRMISDTFAFEPYGLTDIDYLSVSLCGGFQSLWFLDWQRWWNLAESDWTRRYGLRNNAHITNAKDIQVSEDRKEQLGWLSCVNRRLILDQNIIPAATKADCGHWKWLVKSAWWESWVWWDDCAPGKFLPMIADTIFIHVLVAMPIPKNTIGYMADKRVRSHQPFSPRSLWW